LDAIILAFAGLLKFEYGEKKSPRTKSWRGGDCEGQGAARVFHSFMPAACFGDIVNESEAPRERGFFVLIALNCLIAARWTMPSTINAQLISVWFCVGFFTGAGWATAGWLVGRVLSII
jgi:hypothetical protein